MSYILAALNKAERDRQTTRVTGVAALQPMVEASRRSWWLVLLVSMLGSALVLASYLLWQGMTTDSAKKSAVMQSASDAPVLHAETPPGAMAGLPGGIQGALAAQNPPKDGSIKSVTMVPPPYVTSDGSGNGPTLRAMAASASAPSPVPSQSAAEQTYRRDPGPWHGEMPQSEGADAQGLGGAEPQVSDELTPDQLAKIPVLHSLPEHLRAQLPHLELNVHVYAQSQAKRFVYINSERYGEGAQLEGGVVLEKIIPNGVVLRHGGTLFRLLLET